MWTLSHVFSADNFPCTQFQETPYDGIIFRLFNTLEELQMRMTLSYTEPLLTLSTTIDLQTFYGE